MTTAVDKEHPTLRSGWKTTEFWLAFVLSPAVGALLAAEIFPPESVWAKVLTIIATMLGSLGYSVARGMAKQAAVAVTKVLLIGFVITSTTACGVCSQDAHRNDLKCVVVRNIVDCTKDAVVSVVPQFMPLVMELIDRATGGDGEIDWGILSRGLIAIGIRDGGCILAAIEAQYLQVTPTGPARAFRQAESYHNGFRRLRAERWPGVNFKVAVKGKELVL